MPAKLHPADAAAARIIGRASRFEIALFGARAATPRPMPRR